MSSNFPSSSSSSSSLASSKPGLRTRTIAVAAISLAAALLIPPTARAQWTSQYAQVNLAGSFQPSPFNPNTLNMALISNGAWQVYVSLEDESDIQFKFTTPGFAIPWGEDDQVVTGLPITGTAETPGTNNIVITNTVDGTLRFVFDDQAPTYRVEDVSFLSTTGPVTEVFINEFHYDNDGTDEQEGVEIAGPAGTDLGDYYLLFYNGNDGGLYDSNNLSGTIDNDQNGMGAVFFPVAGIQNGAPDGLALVKDGTNVLQFLSYEGSFTAMVGAAAGRVSDDVNVQETGSTPVGYSLQLIGSGSVYEDFLWSSPRTNSAGAPNGLQTFNTPAPPAAGVLVSNLVTTPAQPGTNDPVLIEADISPVNSPSNIHATAFYRIGDSGPFLPVAMTNAGNHYAATSSIPAQPRGTLVQYYLFVTFLGPGTNSPTLFPEDGPNVPQSYSLSKNEPNSVWLNELNTAAYGFESDTNEFIELAGITGTDIGGWTLELFDSSMPAFAIYEFPGPTVLLNDFNGFGFFVIGESNIPVADLLFTNTYSGAENHLPENGALRLKNEIGDTEFAYTYGPLAPSFAGFTFIGAEDDFGFDEEILAVTGTGGSATNFTTFVTNMTASAGGLNAGQVLVSGNTNNPAPLLFCPPSVDLACTNELATVDTNVTAIGLCGNGTVTVTRASVTNSGTGCLGSPRVITNIFTALSDCNSTSICEQVITIEDTEFPQIDCAPPALLNEGFEFGSFIGWTLFADLSLSITLETFLPRSGVFHAMIGPTIFSPDDLEGLDLWLKADAGVETASGSVVTNWTDQSGNGRDAVPADPSTGPSLQPDAINGLPTVFFDGTDDRLFFPTSGAQTVVIVTRVDASGQDLDGIIGLDGADRGIRRSGDSGWRHPGSGSDFSNPGGSEFYVDGQAASNAAEDVFHILAAVRGGSTQEVDALGGYFAGREFPGDIAEVLVYNRALATQELSQVGYYLEDRYALDTLYGPPPGTSNSASFHQDLPAVSGQLWYASARIATPDYDPLQPGNVARVELEFFDAATNLLEVHASSNITSESGVDVYHRVSAYAPAPQDTAFARVRGVYENESVQVGRAFFDDLILSRYVIPLDGNCEATIPDYVDTASVYDNCGLHSVTQFPAPGTALNTVEDRVITLFATDTCGLVNTCQFTVAVVDDIPPVIDCPSNLIVECRGEISEDDAANLPYLGGWNTGDNGGPNWGAGWTLTTTVTGGHFIASSTGNGGGVDSNSDGDIDVDGKAWGLFAGTNGLAEAYRLFNRPLSDQNQTFAILMDNGWIETGGKVGFDIQDAGTATDRLSLVFTNGSPNYLLVDGSGYRDTGIAFTDEGLRVRIRLEPDQKYVATVTRLSDNVHTQIFGVLAGGMGLAVDRLHLFNQAAGEGAQRDAFFNAIGLYDVAPPDPSEVATEDACDDLVEHVGSITNIIGCPGIKIVQRTYRATDLGGNESECTHFITVEDTTLPTLTTSNVTVQCSESIDPAVMGEPIATDDCAGALVDLTYDDVLVGGGCPSSATITRTWTAADTCGNATQAVQVITVEDTLPPVFTSCPSDVTLACGDSIAPSNTGVAAATDNCGALTLHTSGLSGTLAANADAAANILETLTNADIGADRTVIIELVASRTELSGGDSWFALGLNPAGLRGLTGADLGVLARTIIPNNTGTHNLFDDGGNVASAASSPDSVIVRITATVTLSANGILTGESADIVVQYDDGDDGSVNVTLSHTFTIDANELRIGVGNLSRAHDYSEFTVASVGEEPITIAYDDDVPGPCGVITRTWTATDACGNSNQCQQVITVVDANSPDVTITAIETVTNDTIRIDSTGTNTWDLVPLYATNLVEVPQVWLPMIPVTNTYINGTNLTVLNLPVTNNPILLYFQIRQDPP